jgi:hypothetical protein
MAWKIAHGAIFSVAQKQTEKPTEKQAEKPAEKSAENSRPIRGPPLS